MVERLKNNDIETAINIREVFQLSYAIEAKILNAINFPPLQRPLEDYINSTNAFFGFFKNQELAGAIEIHHNDIATYIDSLVVNPKYFKQGIASKLLEFVFNASDSEQFFVETGLKNKPAIQLYLKFGFKEIKQWDTDHGVRKMKLGIA
jgi:ribosomal protein S18 acetylase RimI-like enzyme